MRTDLFRPVAAFVTGLVLGGMAAAEPSTTGQTGLINMPDARIEKDGTLRFGVSYFRPYLPVWSSITLLPRLELSGRYTIIRNLPSDLGQGFGDFKDKAFDAKALLLREDRWWPDVSLGYQDFTGTGLFSAKYGVVTKRVRNAEFTLGYGTDRIDGLFGGLRLQPTWNRNLAFVMEYDANDYKHDFAANESGADTRHGGATYGLEYRTRWYGAQLSLQGDDIGVTTYVSIPLMDKEFVPKIDEPDPYTKQVPKVALEEWRAHNDYAARLGRTLTEHDYRNVRLGFDGHTLRASLTNTRISLTGRAVGRAARILLALGPENVKAIRITYLTDDLPALTYDFTDTRKLQRYFDGLLSREQLNYYLDIAYADPVVSESIAEQALDIPVDDEPLSAGKLQRSEEGHLLSFRKEGADLSTFQIVPFNVGLFFNDPNGAVRYWLFGRVNYTQQIGRGRFFEGGAEVTLHENVSGVSQENNSPLHHVRSDIGKYLEGNGGRFKLTRLLVNQYLQLGERLYARLTGGLYEMMFAGTGGQVLYLPERGNWAADLSVDWLQQRATEGMFKFRDYRTLTALGAVHYRVPRWGVTATARVGRFLAKDNGVRFELKRRFRSGITVGAWYTRTDADDDTPPGSPGDPYFDKGIFASIPLNSMLTRDTKARANFSLRPWTRDGGQMVDSPGDLYTSFERTLMLDNADYGVGSDVGQ